MKISKLILHNFRSHLDTTLVLDRLNIIRGHNAAGKSSLALAIEYLLTGRCQVTDAAGRGAEALISDGAQSFNLELETESGYRIQASKSAASSSLVCSFANEHKLLQFAGKQAQVNIAQNLGSPELLGAVLNAGRFLEMNDRDRRGLLASALGSDPVEIDKEMQELQRCLGPLVTYNVETAADVDSVYKRYFEQRTNVNRELKALGDLTAPEIPADLPTLMDVAEKITRLLKERDEVVTRRAQKQEAHRGAVRAQEQAAQRKGLLTQRRDDAETQMLESEEIARLQKAVKDKAKVAKVEKQIRDAEAALAVARRQLAAVQAQPEACPTCGRMHDEETLKAQKALRDTSEREIQELETALEKARADRRKLPDPEVAEQKLAEHQRAQKTVLDCDAELRAMNIPAEIPALDLSAEDQQLAQIDERLTRGRQVEQQVRDLHSKAAQFQQVASKKQRLEQQLEALEKLVAYFSDKGPLKAALVGGRLPAFRDRINQVLMRWNFECQFELDPYQLKVGYHAGTSGLELRQLSESEAYRFSIAFQIALAEATGVRLVVIDRADMLTTQARRELGEILLDSGLDQAIVLSTSEVTEFPTNAPDAVRFFNFQNLDGHTQVTCSAKDTHYAQIEE